MTWEPRENYIYITMIGYINLPGLTNEDRKDLIKKYFKRYIKTYQSYDVLPLVLNKYFPEYASLLDKMLLLTK